MSDKRKTAEIPGLLQFLEHHVHHPELLSWLCHEINRLHRRGVAGAEAQAMREVAKLYEGKQKVRTMAWFARELRRLAEAAQPEQTEPRKPDRPAPHWFEQMLADERAEGKAEVLRAVRGGIQASLENLRATTASFPDPLPEDAGNGYAAVIGGQTAMEALLVELNRLPEAALPEQPNSDGGKLQAIRELINKHCECGRGLRLFRAICKVFDEEPEEADSREDRALDALMVAAMRPEIGEALVQKTEAEQPSSTASDERSEEADHRFTSTTILCGKSWVSYEEAEQAIDAATKDARRQLEGAIGEWKASLGDGIRKLWGQRADAQTEESALRKQLEEAWAKWDTLRRTWRATEDDNAKLRERLEEAEQDYTATKATCEKVWEVVKAYCEQHSMTTMTEAVQQIVADNAKLREEVERLREQLGKAREAGIVATKRLKHALEREDGLMQEVERLREQLAKVTDGTASVCGVDIPIVKPIANMVFAHEMTCALGLDEPGVLSVSESKMVEEAKRLRDLLAEQEKGECDSA